MIDLVLIYCLSSEPDRCVERRQELETAVSSTACIMSAQVTAQEYVRSHPAYRLAAWRCEIDRPRESPA